MPFWSNETCSYSSSVDFLSVEVSVLWYYPVCPVALRTLTSTLRASDTWFKVFTLKLWHLIDSSRLTVLEIWWNKMILFDLKRSLVGEVSLSPLKDLPGSCSPLLMHARESSLNVYQLSSWGGAHSIAPCVMLCCRSPLWWHIQLRQNGSGSFVKPHLSQSGSSLLLSTEEEHKCGHMSCLKSVKYRFKGLTGVGWGWGGVSSNSSITLLCLRSEKMSESALRWWFHYEKYLLSLVWVPWRSFTSHPRGIISSSWLLGSSRYLYSSGASNPFGASVTWLVVAPPLFMRVVET